MKNLFLSVIVLVSSHLALATSIDKTPVVATVTGLEHGITQAAVLADGRFIVVTEGKVVRTKVSAPVLAKISSAAMELSNVELKDETYMIVCKKMSIPKLTDLKVAKVNAETQEFERSTRLILTDIDCNVSHVVFPIVDSMNALAHELRSMIVVLALNTLK